MADKEVVISTEKRVALVAILFAFGMLLSFFIGESAMKGLVGLHGLVSIFILIHYLTR
tara:strand:- start:64 stop:237 length:174 start_codon:yes stop_codon:yes gene_type:complete